MAPKTFSIDVVMSVYNHEDTLSEAIESVLMQQGPLKLRLFCFNDASTDNSAKILKQYQERFPNIISVFTSPTNQGSGKAQFYYHNPQVTSQFWCFLAGDDYWTDQAKLIKQCRLLDLDQELVGCSCNTYLKNEVTGITSIIRPSIESWSVFDIYCQKPRPSFYVHTSSILWRNTQLKDGFFLPKAFKNKGVYGDVMLMLLMLQNGGKMQNIDQTMSCYRYTGEGVWSKLSEQEQKAFNETVFERAFNHFDERNKLKIKSKMTVNEYKR